MSRACLAILVSALCPLAAQDGLRLYLPLDGLPDPAVAANGEVQSGALRFEPGRQGEAVRLTADLRLPTAGNWPVANGTFAVWVCFREGGQVAAPRYLFCVYGHPSEPAAYQRNRLCAYAADGRLHVNGYTAAGRPFSLSSSIVGWEPETWHHVAVTWANLGSGQPNARLALFLDGSPVTELKDQELTIERVAEVLDLGRDSDGSPDYTDGLLDELYVYDRALPAEVIAAAAARPAQQAALATTPGADASPAGWHDAGNSYRGQITVPASLAARREPCVAVPARLGPAAAAISGEPRALDPASLRVTDEQGGAAPAWLDGERILLRLPGEVPAGTERRLFAYFDTIRYDLATPLQARRVQATRPAAPAPFKLPDYATEQLGKPWDFDDGSFSGIDQWGNQPDFIRHEVVDGVLKLDVQKDPYFIWGDMWGQVTGQATRMDLDVGRYRLLEIRLKQSVNQATWTLFGRPVGKDNLITHEFAVSGTSWQTVRVDLYEQARWRGRLQSFRIDPTNNVQAQVEIDSIRILALDQARLERVETRGAPTAPPAALRVLAPERAQAGQRLPLVVMVTDRGGQPVAGQPVSVSLAGPGGGELLGAGYAPHPQDRLLLSDRTGRVQVTYVASTKVAPAGDRLTIAAPFTQVTPREERVELQPGPAAQVVFAPARTVILKPGVAEARLVAQIADSYGNAVAAAGRRIRFAAEPGARVTATEATTGADGSVAVTVGIDPAKRWVARVAAEAADLRGVSPAVCVTPDRRDWGASLQPNGYFAANGEGWLPLGGFYANWVSEVPRDGEAGRKLTSFVDTTDAQKDAWLRFLRDQGVTAMRFMLRAHRPGGMEPLDIGGKVNPELYAEVLRYLDLARPYGIRFLVVLHEDYTKPMYVNAAYRERYCLPRWQGEDLDALPPFQRRFVRDGRLLDSADLRYVDPDAIACQDQYTREIVGLLKDNPQIFAYELENEQVAVPVSWVNHQAEVIRAVDPRTPVCMSHGGGGVHTGDPYFWRTKSTIDFYTYHLYPVGRTTPVSDYGHQIDLLCRYGRMAGRSMLGESVGDEFSAAHAKEADRRRVARDTIWLALVNANPGVMFWNQRGYEVAEFKLARQVADQVKLATWTVRRAPLGIVVAHPLETDVWYRSAEGGEALQALAATSRHYLQLGADFDFAWSAEGYAQSAALGVATLPAPTRRPVAPPAGFEAATISRADGSEGLTYLRNLAAIEPWSPNNDGTRLLYQRTVASRPCAIQLGLGAGAARLQVTDLVTGASRTIEARGDQAVDLGATDHDFAIHWTIP